MRFALRSLLKTPGFTAVAVLTLALCIGANSAIFSVVNAILLKPYPWPGSERLVYVHNTFPRGGGVAGGISIPDYIDHHANVKSFAESALIAGLSANLSFDGTPERVYGLTVTPSLFPMLQTRAAIGRTFTEDEARLGAAKTVVLTHALWKSRFAADRAVIGKTLHLNGEPHEVIGIMPEGFYFPSLRAQLFVPYIFTDAQKSDQYRYTQYSTMLARLKPDATIGQAQRELDEVHRIVRERLPSARNEFAGTGYGSVAQEFLASNTAGVRDMLWLLQGGVAAALLIGCANVANLLLTRASARQREFAIRSALGAGRAVLVRQLMTESLILFVMGGALGVLLAWWSLSAIHAVGVQDLPRGFSVALERTVVLFTLGCALVTGLAAGALPAFSSTRGNAADALKSAGGRSTASRRQTWLRGTLAVSQIALSLMLVATAALLLRSFARAQSESPGFSSENLLTAALSLPASRYPTPEKRAAFAEQLSARLAAIPGVASAGLTNALPFGASNPQGGYQIEGHEVPDGRPNPNGMIRQVSPGYFPAMGIQLLRGRLLNEADAFNREKVVVVDRFLAERYWPGADPIGKRVSRGDGATMAVGTWTIVGVVSTVKHWDLTQPITKETLYFPYAQASTPSFWIVIRARGDPSAIIGEVRKAVLAVDPEQPVYDIKTMDARLAESLQSRRTPVVLLGVFAVVALLLASLGIYGVLAFSVGQRTSEFGVRMALGADRSSILALVLRQGAAIIAVGVALGIAGYFAAGSVISAQLYGVQMTDLPTLIAAPALLASVAFLACWLPARRATKVNPLTALRAE
jgi:predicted permease